MRYILDLVLGPKQRIADNHKHASVLLNFDISVSNKDLGTGTL